MIPEFPDFVQLDLKNKSQVEKYTKNYKPYSSFNFTNSLAWDIRNERMVSILNGNLVILFTDYVTSEFFLSFIGKHKPFRTIEELLLYSQEIGTTPTLRFITEETVSKLNHAKFLIQEDRDSYDYIYSTSKLAALEGSKLKSKRQNFSKFARENPNAIFEVQDLSKIKTQKNMLSLFKSWENNKVKDKKEYKIHHETIALKNFFKSHINKNIIVTSLMIDKKMIGFSIDELLEDNYAIGHFAKADTSYKGIYEFLNQKTAEHLAKYVDYWNWQQDLGIEGLRKLKMSYGPVEYLKKYTVTHTSNRQ